MKTTLMFTLPFPPSVNTYYRTYLGRMLISRKGSYPPGSLESFASPVFSLSLSNHMTTQPVHIFTPGLTVQLTFLPVSLGQPGATRYGRNDDDNRDNRPC